MIEVRDLTKRYGPFTAVEGVSFRVEEGEVLGFIGPNGAGKTTTMRILTGFLPATEGTAIVAGYDVFESPLEVKRRVGYLPETPPLYRELTVGQYLAFAAELRGLSRSERFKRIGDVMERVGLKRWERRILGSLSKGYRQRVGLAQALLHDPQVLILDEPTSGLDPRQTAGVRELIRELAGERTVILSTHILREVEALCGRVVMINKGKVAAAGPMDEVRSSLTGVRYAAQIEGVDELEAARAVGAIAGVLGVTPDDGWLLVESDADPRAEIAALASAQSWRLLALERRAPTLEEAFLAVVGAEGGLT